MTDAQTELCEIIERLQRFSADDLRGLYEDLRWQQASKSPTMPSNDLGNLYNIYSGLLFYLEELAKISDPLATIASHQPLPDTKPITVERWEKIQALRRKRFYNVDGPIPMDYRGIK